MCVSGVPLLGPRAWQGAPSATRLSGTLDARCAMRPLRILRRACVCVSGVPVLGSRAWEERTLDAIAGVSLLGPRAWQGAPSATRAYPC